MKKRKHKAPEIDIASLQPDELNDLKKVLREYLQRMQNIDNEIATLREDKKQLQAEFEEKLDLPILQSALKVVGIETTVPRRGTYDAFVEVLRDDLVNDLIIDE